MSLPNFFKQIEDIKLQAQKQLPENKESRVLQPVDLSNLLEEYIN